MAINTYAVTPNDRSRRISLSTRDLSLFMRLLYPDLFLKRSCFSALSWSLCYPEYVAYSLLYTVCCTIRMHRKNDDVYSYVVGVGSVMGYWVTFDQPLLRGIPKSGIVSQEEVEIHLRLERNFCLKYCRSCITRYCNALTSGSSFANWFLRINNYIRLRKFETLCTCYIL